MTTSSNNLSASDISFMDVAFKYAEEALEKQEVPVGCIFVRNNEIIGRGRNEVNETRNATRHAELVCLDQILSSNTDIPTAVTLRECTVYVTVEPCIMCTAALYSANVRRIVFGCRNDRFGGTTVHDVAAVVGAGTTVLQGGYRAAYAMELLKAFYKGTNPNAPVSKVRVKVAQT